MSYTCCPQCGSLLHTSTGGAVCTNTLCDWKEFPCQAVNILTTGTSVNAIEMKLNHIAHMLLDDLIEHHHKIVHTMQFPNNCSTCILIEEARNFLK